MARLYPRRPHWSRTNQLVSLADACDASLTSRRARHKICESAYWNARNLKSMETNHDSLD